MMPQSSSSPVLEEYLSGPGYDFKLPFEGACHPRFEADFRCRSNGDSPKKENEAAPPAERAERSDLVNDLAKIKIDEHAPLTESRLWMKNVIDAIHDDILFRQNDEKCKVPARASSQKSSKITAPSSSEKRRKDSRESARIERFIADTVLPGPWVEGKTPDSTAEQRMEEKLAYFDEAFKGAGKSDARSV